MVANGFLPSMNLRTVREFIMTRNKPEFHDVRHQFIYIKTSWHCFPLTLECEAFMTLLLEEEQKKNQFPHLQSHVSL